MDHIQNIQHIQHHEPCFWFALFIKPHKERSTYELLQQKGYETFLPFYLEKRKWANRQATREKPVFPGYLFCRFNARWRMPILTTPGVVNVLGFAGKPEPIDDGELLAIKKIAASPMGYNPCPYLEAGKRVRIIEGPLTGLKGILLERRQGRRLIVSVTLMQRSVAVELDHCAVDLIAAEKSDLKASA